MFDFANPLYLEWYCKAKQDFDEHYSFNKGELSNFGSLNIGLLPKQQLSTIKLLSGQNSCMKLNKEQ